MEKQARPELVGGKRVSLSLGVRPDSVHLDYSDQKADESWYRNEYRDGAPEQ